MAITFHCKCGRPLRAQPDAAGKKTRCPGCNQVLTIPGAEAKPAPVAAAHEGDPFAPELDWSTLVSPHPPPEADPSRIGLANIKVDASVADAPTMEIPKTEDGSRQYHVLTQKDQGFTGKFNASKLEEVLNAHARQGWSLKAAVTMTMHGHGGNHDELVVILER